MDIDLVYLWVDGNDPVWRVKKNAYLPADRQLDPRVVGECRFVQNEELRYSLRSMEKYAPWIRRVFIITDDQTPAWLDTSNPRVQVIAHREIIPAEILPVFNSTVIELFMPRIPDLSEHFLYANDDMFFSAPIEPGFFFDKQGYPIVRLKRQSLKRHDDETYCHSILRMQGLMRARYGKCSSLAPHHNVDAYRRSDFIECCTEFHDVLVPAAHNRFRAHDNWQRVLVLYYALVKGHGTFRKVHRFNKLRNPWQWLRAAFGVDCGSDSRCIPAYTPDLDAVIQKYNPSLFCLNDDVRITDEDRYRVRQFLQRKFPEKSSFEK